MPINYFIITFFKLSNDLAQQPEWIRNSATGEITGYRFGGADPVFPFSRNYISIGEHKSSMQPTHYNIGFRPKLVVCGVDNNSQLCWYNADTNKHYYGSNTKYPHSLGTYSEGGAYKFDSIDDTGFTFNVGVSSYNNQNMIIFALG